jgi:Fic family protein
VPKNHYNFTRIVDLRKRYYEFSSDKQELLNILAKDEISEQVYNSNAIENSTLTLEETEKILLKLDLERFVSERELYEAKNLATVVDYINQKAKDKSLDIDMILLLHKMLMVNIRPEIAGRFRKDGEWVRVGSHIATNPNDVRLEIDQLLTTYHSSIDQDIIQRIAKFHLGFEHIHPFVDGNGRVGRVLNNYLLIREGYVPINIKVSDQDDYYQALFNFDNFSESQKMEEIIYLALTNSYHKRLCFLENKKIIDLKEYAKIAKTSYNNILNKAKRQTIEAFLQKGVWKIGIKSRFQIQV